jgi:hypothetical protein
LKAARGGAATRIVIIIVIMLAHAPKLRPPRRGRPGAHGSRFQKLAPIPMIPRSSPSPRLPEAQPPTRGPSSMQARSGSALLKAKPMHQLSQTTVRGKRGETATHPCKLVLIQHSSRMSPSVTVLIEDVQIRLHRHSRERLLFARSRSIFAASPVRSGGTRRWSLQPSIV